MERESRRWYRHYLTTQNEHRKYKLFTALSEKFGMTIASAEFNFVQSLCTVHRKLHFPIKSQDSVAR